jgi:hypothetical protein
MMNFVQTYWLSILLVVCFLVIMLLLWKRGKKEIVRKIIYAMVCKAEQVYGSKTGDVKYAEVWSMIYTKLPWIIRFLFSQKELEKLINDGVKLLKSRLENKEFNLLTYNQEVDGVIKDKFSYPLK